MKILIVGAGRIGISVAESLVSEANDITVVDRNPEHIAYLQSRFDLRGIVGEASSPQVLRDAGADDTDMLIAVTSNDETNLVVSLLAARLFNIPTRIARVRNSELRNFPRILGEEGFEATAVIWPEQAVTSYLVKLIDFPEANQVLEFGEGLAALIAVRAKAGSPLVGRRVADLETHLPHVEARIISIFRRNRRLDVDKNTVIEAGDEVICLCDARNARLVLSEIRRHEPPVRNILLAGNASMCLALARRLTSSEDADRRTELSIRILEKDRSKVELLAGQLRSSVIVIEGDYTDEEVLSDAGVETCDLFIALSEDDGDNVLSAMLAKKLGAQRTIALVNRKVYGDLMQGSQIDITLSPSQAALGELIKHVRRGDVTAAYSLRHGVAEALEIVAHGNRRSSRVVGRPIRDLALPEGANIGAVIRGEGEDAVVLMGKPDVVIEAEDHVVVFVASKRLIPKIERLFAVDVGFF